jgi:hypothetical protein
MFADEPVPQMKVRASINPIKAKLSLFSRNITDNNHGGG